MSSTKRLTLVAGLGVLALLSACASKPQVQGARVDSPTPLDQYQIKTHDAPDQVGLTIHDEGLSPAQRDALAAFTARWRAAGGATITLQVPSDAPEPASARNFAMAAESTLAVLGVPYDRVRTVSYAEGPTPKPLVLASFDTVVAEAPDCASVPWGNLSAVGSNAAYKKFGCTLEANLALQVADPRDLRGELPLAPGDNTRRMQILSNYRTGKATSSEKDAQANGAVSAVGVQ
jgi:pilus assembly protein CpaD